MGVEYLIFIVLTGAGLFIQWAYFWWQRTNLRAEEQITYSLLERANKERKQIKEEIANLKETGYALGHTAQHNKDRYELATRIFPCVVASYDDDDLAYFMGDKGVSVQEALAMLSLAHAEAIMKYKDTDITFTGRKFTIKEETNE